jgi:hypothetical protein
MLTLLRGVPPGSTQSAAGPRARWMSKTLCLRVTTAEHRSSMPSGKLTCCSLRLAGVLHMQDAGPIGHQGSTARGVAASAGSTAEWPNHW